VIAKVAPLSQEELDRRRLDASSRVQNLTSIYDELFALVHDLMRERLRPSLADDAELSANITQWRQHALRALQSLNVYAQNGLRNNIDTQVLIEIARHAHEYDTRSVMTSTRQ
jgi:hypothetical protein